MSDNSLDIIAEQTRSRYSRRYREMGYNVKTLGWGTVEQQQLRFDRVLQAVDISGRHVLDIGCGFGDLLDYCNERGRVPAQYTGWDINPELVDEAVRRHQGRAADFSVANLSERSECRAVADVGVMLGVLNFNLGDIYDNLDYSRMMIEKAFKAVGETLVVDFLSTCLTPGYLKEDAVFYHDPEQMLSFALELTPDVTLLHDYPPIPQKEFMLVLHR
ncbi:MAG: hypothetical protein JW384_01681 [Nitrosomonadaceae bacterium]|nr:hypothetical protein [Nitrosomonadaceae bacterium]